MSKQHASELLFQAILMIDDFLMHRLGERGLDEPLVTVKHFQKLSTGMHCSTEKKNQVDQMGFLFFLETQDSGYVFA